MHYLYVTQAKFSHATAKRIDKKIKAIDKRADFVGPLRIVGNSTTGWIERPNDGTNDHLDVRQSNAIMRAIAENEIDG